MKYFSTTQFSDIEIDVEAASLDQLLDAYNSLFAMSDDGGSFPGTKAWAKAKGYADQLRALTNARPEVVEYREQLADAAAAARLAGKDVLGL